MDFLKKVGDKANVVKEQIGAQAKKVGDEVQKVVQ